MASGFSRKAFTRLKMAALAPMPRASTSTAAAVKAGFLVSTRKLWEKFFIEFTLNLDLRAGTRKSSQRCFSA